MAKSIKSKKVSKVSVEKPVIIENPPHLIVEARAGTGKTTTLVEGLRVVIGQEPRIIPSPQQKAVWDAMALSKGKIKSICFVAFNKSIATELQSRVPAGCNASTMHSMGFAAVRKHFGNVRVNEYRVSDIISEVMDRDIREIRKYEADVLKGVQDLVGLCKMNLVVGVDAADWEGKLDAIVSHYQIELNGSRTKVYELVPKVLARCREVEKDKCIDYDDMVWLPVALDLPMTQYDLLLVDEAQDLNRCQQALAKKAGKRLILCGDPKQAIYGFAGADSESMNRMRDELANCQVLPLTVTRRCGKAIVKEAQKYVPDFEAFETNGEGTISNKAFDQQAKDNYRLGVEYGDMLLCRVNAPLVSECFRFIKAGKKANIQGRDVGKGLISTITKLKAANVVDLVSRLSDWFHAETCKELAKRNPSESRLINLQDRYDCLMCFTEGCVEVTEVIAKIDSIFTDQKECVGIKLSSVHKAKGLEAKRVYILQPEKASMPHPMAKTAWAKEQEYNLLYVAITRAIEELVYVS